jgi:hypothetical protein
MVLIKVSIKVYTRFTVESGFLVPSAIPQRDYFDQNEKPGHRSGLLIDI